MTRRRGDELVGDLLVEEVAHRVDEHHPRLAPAQRLLEHVLVQRHAEPGPDARPPSRVM
jgi:hypothetical protein